MPTSCWYWLQSSVMMFLLLLLLLFSVMSELPGYFSRLSVHHNRQLAKLCHEGMRFLTLLFAPSYYLKAHLRRWAL